MTAQRWRTLNFVALPPGWVAVYKTDNETWEAPIPGVLIEGCDGDVRVIAADFMDSHEIVPFDDGAVGFQGIEFRPR